MIKINDKEYDEKDLTDQTVENMQTSLSAQIEDQKAPATVSKTKEF